MIRQVSTRQLARFMLSNSGRPVLGSIARATACGVCVLVAALGAGSSAQGRTVTATPCPHQHAFFCGAIAVPLDYAGRVPGRISLHFAEQAPDGKPVLIALTGGPGQSAVQDATLVCHEPRAGADALPARRPRPAWHRRSREPWTALHCSVSVSSARCRRRSMPSARRRSAHSARSTRPPTRRCDIDILRQALQAPQVALMGVSYGTFVAEQYARRFPGPRVPADPRLGRPAPRHRRVLDSTPTPACRECCCPVCALGAAPGSPAIRSPMSPRSTSASPPIRCAARARRARGRRTRSSRSTTPASSPTCPRRRLQRVPAAGDARRDRVGAARRPGAAAAPAADRRRPADAAHGLSAGLNIATFCEDSELPYSVADTPLSPRARRSSPPRWTRSPAPQFGPIDRATPRSARASPGVRAVAARLVRARRRTRRCPTCRR